MDNDYFPSKNNLVCFIHINASLRMQKQFEGHIIFMWITEWHVHLPWRPYAQNLVFLWLGSMPFDQNGHNRTHYPTSPHVWWCAACHLWKWVFSVPPIISFTHRDSDHENCYLPTLPIPVQTTGSSKSVLFCINLLVIPHLSAWPFMILSGRQLMVPRVTMFELILSQPLMSQPPARSSSSPLLALPASTWLSAAVLSTLYGFFPSTSRVC